MTPAPSLSRALLVLATVAVSRADVEAQQTAASAQSSRGRTLSPLPARVGACRSGTATEAMQTQGVVRVVMLELPGPPRRMLTIGTALRGNAIALVDDISPAPALKVEGERTSATFANDGGLRSGERHTMGLRGRRTELRAADGARAFAFAKQVLARCSRR